MLKMRGKAMDNIQNSAQNNTPTEEFEYIELEEGQELPEGYEYEYIEVPADDVSEMDVVNRSHVLEPEDEDMASVSDIEAALRSSQEEEVKKEVPFPSFLLENNDDNQNSFSASQNEDFEDKSSLTDVSEFVPQEETSPSNMNNDYSDINFLNNPENVENWQEDTRATHDLSEVKVDTRDVHFQENNISSMDVNDYIEPEAHYSIKEVSVTELPPEPQRTEVNVSVEDLAEQMPQSEIDSSFSSLDLGENEVSLDELLQEDNDAPMAVEQAEEDILIDNSVSDEHNEIYDDDSNIIDVPVEEDVTPIEEIPEQNTVEIENSSVEQSFSPSETVDTWQNNVENHPVNVWEEVAPDVSPEHMETADFVSESEPENYENDEKQETSLSIGENIETVNPALTNFEVMEYSADELSQAELSSRLVSKQHGLQSFNANENVFDILLSDVDFAKNELADWNLILFNQSIVPLNKQVAELKKPNFRGINRYISIVQEGNQKIDLFNEENLKIINASHACVAVDGHFICGDFENNSGAVVNDFITLHLQEYAGKKLAFENGTSGILTGPKGCVLFFFGVKNLWVPSSDTAKIDEQKLQNKIAKWYSGHLSDKYFEFSAQSDNAEFIGNDEMNAIHVNVGESTFGWNVIFDNGEMMSLQDVKEYQMRFGQLPSARGKIVFGEKSLQFENVERIVIYKSAQYCFYE